MKQWLIHQNTPESANLAQNDQKSNNQLTGLWRSYFGRRIEFCSSKDDIANKSPYKIKTDLSLRQYTMSQVGENSGKNSAFTVFPRYGSQRHYLFADFKNMFTGKRFEFNEEVIAEAETYPSTRIVSKS